MGLIPALESGMSPMGGKLIAKVINNEVDDIAAIDTLLQIVCFDGKSFMEAEKDIIVEAIT